MAHDMDPRPVTQSFEQVVEGFDSSIGDKMSQVTYAHSLLLECSIHIATQPNNDSSEIALDRMHYRFERCFHELLSELLGHTPSYAEFMSVSVNLLRDFKKDGAESLNDILDLEDHLHVPKDLEPEEALEPSEDVEYFDVVRDCILEGRPIAGIYRAVAALAREESEEQIGHFLECMQEYRSSHTSLRKVIAGTGSSALRFATGLFKYWTRPF